MKKIHALLFSLLLAGCAEGSEPFDLQKLFKKEPTAQQRLVRTAQYAESQGDYPQAIELYNRALESQPGDKDLLLGLADNHRVNGDFDKAIAIYDELLKKDAGLVGAREGKALALMSKGDYDSPVVLFAEILRADPTRWKTLNALGVLFTTRDMQDEAQQYFRTALKYNPESPLVLNNLGLSQALSSQYGPAINSLVQASTLVAPESQERRLTDMHMAMVYAMAGHPDDATDIAKDYFSGTPLDNMTELYTRLARDEQLAKQRLHKALVETRSL